MRKKCLNMFAEIAELNDDCKKFYEQFVKCMKLGMHENSVDCFETAELLRFNTSKSGGEQISFEEYVDRMTEEQNDIYYITGESIAMVSSSSFIENLRKKDHEVPYMADSVDEYTVHQPKDFDGTRPNDNDNLELFKEILPGPSLMQVQSDKRGIAHRARAMVRKSSGSPGEEMMSPFDGDNKKTCCSTSVDRTKGEDRPLAIDISHESVSAAQHRSTQGTQQQHNNCHRKQQQQAGQVEEKGKKEKEEQEQVVLELLVWK